MIFRNYCISNSQEIRSFFSFIFITNQLQKKYIFKSFSIFCSIQLSFYFCHFLFLNFVFPFQDDKSDFEYEILFFVNKRFWNLMEEKDQLHSQEDLQEQDQDEVIELQDEEGLILDLEEEAKIPVEPDRKSVV